MVIFSGVPSNFKAKDRPCTDHMFYSIDDSTLQFKVRLILANPLVSYFCTKTVNLVRVSEIYEGHTLHCFPRLRRLNVL